MVHPLADPCIFLCCVPPPICLLLPSLMLLVLLLFVVLCVVIIFVAVGSQLGPKICAGSYMVHPLAQVHVCLQDLQLYVDFVAFFCLFDFDMCFCFFCCRCFFGFVCLFDVGVW